MVTNDQEYKVLDLKPENIFTFDEGIPGFEKAKKFTVLTDPAEAPFGRLTALDYDLCFLAVDPWLFNKDYAPDVDDADVEKIGSPSNEEILILVIANIPEDPRESTVNLAAPVIINTKRGLGRQVIIRNHAEYSAKFPIWQGK